MIMIRVINFNGDAIDLERLTVIGKVTSKHIDNYAGSISQFEYYVGNTQLSYQGYDSKDKREELLKMWVAYQQNKIKDNTVPPKNWQLGLAKSDVQSDVKELVTTLTPTQLYKLKKIIDLVEEDEERIKIVIKTLNEYF